MIDSVVPRPATVVRREGAFRLEPTTAISFRVMPGEPEAVDLDAGIVKGVARSLQERLRPATGFDFPIVPADAPSAGSIHLAIDRGLALEGYRIDVTASGIEISGGSAAGLFYGSQTLLQLLPTAILRRAEVSGITWAVAGVQITDAPRFGWRGLLLDTSRHFFGRDEVLKLIDALALHRMNVLHLHLTDDQGWRMEIKRYPRLTEVGSRRSRSALGRHSELEPGQEMLYDETPHAGYYSQDDLREIVAYAAKRFITVVPEIDLPGHSQAAIAAYPTLGNTTEPLAVWTRWGINRHVLNVDEATIAFYRNVLDEVLEIFPSEFVHIGGDECLKDEWRESPAAQRRMRELGLGTEDELQSWVIRQMTEHLAARGRRGIGWDEILEGGLPPGTTVMSWRGEEGGIAAAEAGHDVVMTPESHTYLYRHQSDERHLEVAGAPPTLDLQTVYAYDPMPAGLSARAQQRVLGTQCQMWTEFVANPRQMQQKVFPRLSAFSEAAWCVDRDPFDRFQSRLATHVERLRAMDFDVFETER